MNRYKWMIGGLLALALMVVVYTFISSGKGSVGSENEGKKQQLSQSGRETRKPGVLEKSADKTVKGPKQKPQSYKELLKQAGASKPVAVAATPEKKNDASAQVAAAEKAMAAWETLVDELVDAKDLPTRERMDSVKEAFDKLDKKDQMEAVQRSLNLLPDEQFTSLFGILYDKSESPEVLDAIFSDALNRPEDIKVPMMKDLVTDKTHPMFFESARILDVTGELDKMAGKTDEVEDNTIEEELEMTPAPTPSP